MDAILALLSPADIEKYSEEQLSVCRELLDEITAHEGPRTADNTLRPLNRLFLQLGDTRRAIGLLRSVHPQLEFRRTAEQCEQNIAKFFTELGLNRELYEAVKSCDCSELDRVGKRMSEHLLRDFHRAGVDRDEATRAEVQRPCNELVELGQEFSRNILSDVRSIEIDDISELDGLPEDYIEAHSPDGQGRIKITTEYPDYNPFMSYARNGKLRERLYRVFRNRAYPQNVPVLESILSRRYQLATLLGYAHWAEFASEDKMIKNADSIGRFIERVSESAAKRSFVEYEGLLSRKRKDEPGSNEVHDWEKGYYEELLRAEEYRIDSRKLRPYFSYTAVKEGMFAVSRKLFKVDFRPVSGVAVWNEDVEVIDVYEGDRKVGRVYLDMHPREGKFKHAAMFPLVQGVRDGPPPEAALICNFPSPGISSRPALLEHDDVVTFFHEFGHLMHHLLARDIEWAEFSGTGTEWDFVEVPSQLLEEWAWDTATLQNFARHYETGEVVPSEVVERLRRARDFGQGLQVRQQMYYASLSLKCHQGEPENLDLVELQRSLQNRFSRFRFVEGTFFHASFGHLEGYSALYYTYMWSLVIEKDIFKRFQEKGLMDREVSARYHDRILSMGGTKDAAELVKDFLGRDYNFEAFENWLNSPA